MVIILTPQQFEDLTKVIEASAQARARAEEGELSLQSSGNTDAIEWTPQEVKITLQD